MVNLEVLAKLGYNLLGILFDLFLLLFFGTIIFLFVRWYLHQKRYNVDVLIRKADTNEVEWDKGGLFIEKKLNAKKFWLKKSRKGFDPDNINYLISDRGRKIVEFVKDKESVMLPAKIRYTSNPGLVFEVGEEDVNWALDFFNSFEKSYLQDIIKTYLPFAVLTFVCTLIVILIFYLFKQVPQWKNLDIEQARIIADGLKQAASKNVIT